MEKLTLDAAAPGYARARRRAAVSLLALLLGVGPVAHGAECTAASGAHKVALLELYTSEGCSSCPPADRWVSGLAESGLASDRVIPLGFHVDYWNYLGWKDPFARSSFTERQKRINAANRTSFVYTPELVLDGKIYRRELMGDDFSKKVQAINRAAPQARLALAASPRKSELAVSVNVAVPASGHRATSEIYLVLTENRLSNRVAAGENAGRTLHHDHVVREFAGPFVLGGAEATEIRHSFNLGAVKRQDAQVIAFIQNRNSGDVLQALSMPVCQP